MPLEFGPTIEEERDPVTNAVEKLELLYYGGEKVTASSKFARSPSHPQGRERPFFVRGHRAELYKRFKESNIDREDVLLEAHLRDNIAEQYLNQTEVKINLPEYGELMARMIDIVPQESLVGDAMSKNKPPIFLIPGISNDIECVNNMASEIAMQGRRVIVLAYPESFKGHSTEKFAEAVKRDTGFGPHTTFYKAAIKKILGEEQPFELWGYSTGAPIAAAILKEEGFQKRTKNAAFICPAASVDQSVNSLKVGTIHDLGFIKQHGRSAYLTFTVASKEPQDKDQLTLRNKILASLMEKISKVDDSWKEARVQNGGHIAIVSGGKDEVTKSYKMNEQFKQNPQALPILLQDAYHCSPQVNADVIIPEILNQLA